MSDSTSEVQLVFAPGGRRGIKNKKLGVKEFSAKIGEIKNWFKDYKISSIELWIRGAVREIKQKQSRHYNQKLFDFKVSDSPCTRLCPSSRSLIKHYLITIFKNLL